MAPICGFLQCLLLTMTLPPKDLMVALIIGVYRLHEHIN
jgi:hypothetical protein